MSSSGPSLTQRLKCLRNALRNLFRRFRTAVPFGERFGECQLVHGVEQTAPFFSGSGVNLAGDQEHGD